MTSWNVALRVVDLVEADTDVQALGILRARLDTAGFDVLDGSGNAFESEVQRAGKYRIRRPEWRPGLYEPVSATETDIAELTRLGWEVTDDPPHTTLDPQAAPPVRSRP